MKLFIILAFVAGVLADVSNLGYNYPQPAPQNSYLPPLEEPQNTYLPVEQPHNSYLPATIHVEQPLNTYIPPAAPVVFEQPQNAYIPPAVESGLAEDGYRYKAVRRVVTKHRA